MKSSIINTIYSSIANKAYEEYLLAELEEVSFYNSIANELNSTSLEKVKEDAYYKNMYLAELKQMLLEEQKELALYEYSEEYSAKGFRKALFETVGRYDRYDGLDRTSHSRNKYNNARITKKNKVTRVKPSWRTYSIEDIEE